MEYSYVEGHGRLQKQRVTNLEGLDWEVHTKWYCADVQYSSFRLGMLAERP